MNYVELDEFPHGLSCPTCKRVILAGQPYKTVPLNEDADIITCMYC